MSIFRSPLIVLMLTLISFLTTAQDQPSFINLVIGTYSKQSSEGIYTTKLDLSTGIFTPAKLAFKSKDPTYLTISKKRVIYAALREKKGVLKALSIDKEGQFTFLSQQKVWGNDPCYLSLSHNEQFIASANYNGGNVSIFKLSPTGELLTAPTILHHAGQSLHPKRQTSPHPHWVKWSPHDENTLYVIDLGTDKVMKYNFDYSTGDVSKGRVAFSSSPGNGPRHLVFHPTKKIAYILNELSSTIDLVNIETDGSFSLVNQASTLPKGYAEHNQAAHIAISNTGKYLYASNRGLNSIAVFNLDENGEMALAGNVETGGDWPRFFKLFDEYGLLLIANKKSNNITGFKVQEDGNLLKTSHQLTIDQPTFIEEY